MGQNPHGIFMCAVVDVMHAIQHGIIMYILDCFKRGLNAQSLAKLDRMAHIFDKTSSRSIRSSFPRTDFSRGITNLTMVECSEQSGALFLISSFIMHIRMQGWDFLEHHFPALELHGVLGTTESLLCFEAWLDQYTFWEIGDPHNEATEAEAAICSLMKLITTYLPREKGSGWKVSKFHEIKHIVCFIRTFGAPGGYNASRPEEHHKVHAKRPGRRSQKNVDTIDQQCGRRIADGFVIDTMHSLFETKPQLNTLSPGGVANSADDAADPLTTEVGSGHHIMSGHFLTLPTRIKNCVATVFSTVRHKESSIWKIILSSLFCRLTVTPILMMMGWEASSAAQSITSTMMKQIRIWCPFAATQTIRERDIPGMIGLSSVTKMMMEMGRSSHLIL